MPRKQDLPRPTRRRRGRARFGETLTQDDLSVMSKARVLKPLGRFPDFAACVTAMSRKLGSVGAARRYCGALQQRIEG